MNINFNVEHSGEALRHVSLKKGNEIRPLWKKMETMTVTALPLWAERFDSTKAVASSWALTMALESSAKVSISPREQYSRTILLEINRMIWLTRYLENIFYVLGERTFRSQTHVLGERILNLQDDLCGARILPHAIKLGGTRRPLAMGDIQKIQKFREEWGERWAQFSNVWWNDPLILSRLRGVLPISFEFALEKSLWGVIGKGSGLGYDVRKHRPFGAYPFVDFEIPLENSFDALGRFRVVKVEIDLTLKLLKDLAGKIPEMLPKAIIDVELEDGFFRGWAESALGPVLSMVEVTDGVAKTVRLFSSDQRLRSSLDFLLSGIRADDFHLAVASLGYSPEGGEL